MVKEMSKYSIKWVGSLFTWSCPAKMLPLGLAISSKLYIWSETLKLLCPFYMCLCSMRQFKRFSNFGISWLYLNSFISTQSQSCGPLAFISATHLSRFAQIDIKRTLKVFFIATHHWRYWEVVGTTSLCEFMWKWTRASQAGSSISLFSFSSIAFKEVFLQEKQRNRKKSFSVIPPLLSWLSET